MQDILCIYKRRGGSDNKNLSHYEWLKTVQSAPDVISMSFIPITSLLNGVQGSGFLSHAINLYLRCEWYPFFGWFICWILLIIILFIEVSMHPCCSVTENFSVVWLELFWILDVPKRIRSRNLIVSIEDKLAVYMEVEPPYNLISIWQNKFGSKLWM